MKSVISCANDIYILFFVVSLFSNTYVLHIERGLKPLSLRVSVYLSVRPILLQALL